MKNTVLTLCAACIIGCNTPINLAVPEAFKQQATLYHVNGARGNQMSFANYTTSKIKRGIHLTYPGWGGRGFVLENLLLSQLGLEISEAVQKEKARFRYTFTDGKNSVELYADEKRVTTNLELSAASTDRLFGSINQVERYEYVFSALISDDTTQSSRPWELVMTNISDRHAKQGKNPFGAASQEDSGIATNGSDTIFIRALNLKKTETAGGKTAQLPFKVLSGYELSTSGGVIAIVDMINLNIWLYNELDAMEKLRVGAMATAIFARKVHDAKW